MAAKLIHHPLNLGSAAIDNSRSAGRRFPLHDPMKTADDRLLAQVFFGDTEKVRRQHKFIKEPLKRMNILRDSFV
jgi:hypothetical protein